MIHASHSIEECNDKYCMCLLWLHAFFGCVYVWECLPVCVCVCVCVWERDLLSGRCGFPDILLLSLSPPLSLVHALNGLTTGFLTAVATATVSDTCYFLNNYSTRERRWVEGWRKEGKRGRGEDERQGTAGHEPFAQNGWLKERYEWKKRDDGRRGNGNDPVRVSIY